MIMSSVRISITLTENTLETVEKIRGLVSRSAFIESVLAKNLKKRNKRL